MEQEIAYQSEYRLDDFIGLFRKAYKGEPTGKARSMFELPFDSFCLYAKEYVNTLTADMMVFPEHYPTVKEDAEVFPDFVAENALELVYYGERFEDALSLAIEQKPDATTEDFVAALNYYDDNDDFMDL